MKAIARVLMLLGDVLRAVGTDGGNIKTSTVVRVTRGRRKEKEREIARPDQVVAAPRQAARGMGRT